MGSWLRRVRGAVVLGVVWALGWAIVGGGIMEGIFDRDGKILDMWPQTLAIPGFLSGVIFSASLAISEGRRRFDELSLPRFTALGAVTGLVLGCGVLALGSRGGPVGLALATVIVAPMTLLSAASAAGTLALARRGAKRELSGSDGSAGNPRLSEGAEPGDP